MHRIVMDTNVLVAGLRSRRGASHELLLRLGTGRFLPVVTAALCFEYEDVLHRPGLLKDWSPESIDAVLDYLLSESVECIAHFRWRPYLSDPNDEHVLEAALAGGAGSIVTHNVADFKGIESLGIKAIKPDQFLSQLRSS